MSTLQTTNYLPDFSTPSFTTNIRYPLSAAYPAILPISNPRSFLLTNSAPGKTPTSSSKKVRVTLVTLSEVVIRTFGGEFGSQSEKYDANVSESMSTKVSGAIGAPSAGVVFDPLGPPIGREVESSKHYPVSAVDRRTIRKSQTPISCRGSWGRSRPTFCRVETNFV